MRVSGCSLLPIDQPWDIVDALYTSPVAVQIEADTWNFQHYKSGIFKDANCGATLNHAVLVVGWGQSNGMNYFIIKNSWGTAWGEQGYMRILLTDGQGICGMNKIAYQPNVHEPARDISK